MIERRAVEAIVTSVCAVVAPFLIAASAVVIGVGLYRMVSPSAANQAPGFSAGWEVIGPAWPLYLGAMVFTAAGWYFWRKRSKRLAS